MIKVGDKVQINGLAKGMPHIGDIGRVSEIRKGVPFPYYVKFSDDRGRHPYREEELTMEKINNKPILSEAMANETLVDHHLPPVFSYRLAYFLGARDQANLDTVVAAFSGIKGVPQNMPDSLQPVMSAARELAKEVAPIYKFLKWNWYDEGIPTEESIYNVFMELFEQLVEDDAEWIKSGGLVVSCREDEEGKPIYTLSFEVEREVTA